MGYSPEYVAGVLDSDGTINIQKLKRPNENIRYSLKVGIGQYRWDDFYEWLVEEFGGSKYVYPSRNNLPEWVVCGAESKKFLEWIHPHLYIKKEQCEIALAFVDTVRVGGNRRGDGNTTGQLQAPMYEQMYELNRRTKKEY